MSKAELKRAAELCIAQKTGQISSLRFQPRYDLIVEGTKITTYVADFEYRRNGVLITEDTKPTGDFMDAGAKLKIALFNALYKKHGLSVTISRR